MSIFFKLRQCFEKDWNESLYWKRRLYVQSHQSGGLLTYLRLMLLRRTEAQKCCTTGLSLRGNCCHIESPLTLYHGLNGIVIAPNVRIGKNVTIFQRVTISKDNPKKTTIIEDGVLIGAGAVILNNVHIGKGAKIGANTVVVCDVPAGATAIGIPAKILEQKDKR